MLQFYMPKQDKESYLIEKIDSKYIGDDAAVVGEYIYSVDAFFEDIHFCREWMNLSQIARKSMLVNISDAVAMNAAPVYALLSISIPKDMTHNEIDQLMNGFVSTAKEYGCEIIGGDTVGGDKLNISITIISKSKRPLYRKGLKLGNLLAFTGTLGESSRDLNRLMNGERIDVNSRFFEPTLRADFIKESRPYLNAGMDISDGLFCDANKLLDINKYGYSILNNIDKSMGSSGEEYEMLIGFDEEHFDKVSNIAKEHNVPLTIFARIANNSNRFMCQSHHF